MLALMPHFYPLFFMQIFDKALEEPKYSNLYAQLCHRLCEDVPNFEPPSSGITVRTYLSSCIPKSQVVVLYASCSNLASLGFLECGGEKLPLCNSNI